MRKVRASQGRVPANGRWRRLQGKCNRKKPPRATARGKDGKARQELTRVPATEARCKPHLMQDPIRSHTAARRASKEIAMATRQRAAQIDDRPTTELGLRPRRQLSWKRQRAPFPCEREAGRLAIDKSTGEDVGLRPTPRQGIPATSIVVPGTAVPGTRFG